MSTTLRCCTAAFVLLIAMSFFGQWVETSTLKPTKECNYDIALQMLFLQDVSNSFETDLVNLKKFLPIFIDDLVVQYPLSEFALATFCDYPMINVGYPLGRTPDYCFRLDVDFTSDSNAVLNAIEHLTVVSGRDAPEAQLTALHHAAKGKYFRERDLPQETKDVKLIVLSTDAAYHRAGELEAELAKHKVYREKQYKNYFPLKYKEYFVRENDGDENLSCVGNSFEDYPTEDQVITALDDANSAVIMLVTADQVEEYQKFASLLKNNGILAFVSEIKSDSSDLIDALNEGMAEVYRLVCIDTTTTSTATTTTTIETATQTAIETTSEDTIETTSEDTIETTSEDTIETTTAATITTTSTNTTVDTTANTTTTASFATVASTITSTTSNDYIPDTSTNNYIPLTSAKDEDTSTEGILSSKSLRSTAQPSKPTATTAASTASTSSSAAAEGSGVNGGIIAGAAAGGIVALLLAVAAVNATMTGSPFGAAGRSAGLIDAESLIEHDDRQIVQDITSDMFTES